MRSIRWGRLLRRSGGLCMALLALWLLGMGAGAEALDGAVDRLTGSPAFVTAALRTELGALPTDGLSFWQRLAVEQSPLLLANPPGERPPTAADAPLPDAQPAPDHDDLSPEPAVTTAPGDIVEQTLVPTSEKGYVTGAGLYLYNRTDLTVDLADLAGRDVGFTLSPAQEGPQILIVHTHATEAYTPDGGDIYTPSDSNSRTLDQDYNMVRVGEEMAAVFSEMGLKVLHDKTLYDYPQYNGAYTRSREAVAGYLKEYPTIRVVLDVHRDALIAGDGTVYKTMTTVNGAKTAQVMLVVGTGEAHPNWAENLTLACKVQKSLDTLYPTLARPMALRTSHYNQQLCPGSLLVEVGSHGNTLQEALAAAREFSRATGAVLLGLVTE